MLKKEAIWLADKIFSLNQEKVFSLLDIGSSTKKLRMKYSPWIDEYIYDPAKSQGKNIIHMDMKKSPDVDVVGDLSDKTFLANLKKMNVNSVLCANLLEHVTNKKEICNSIVDLIPSGGYVFVTVPYKFPFHIDPIDTMFRPNVEELAVLFPSTELIYGEILECENYYDYLDRSKLRLFLSYIKLLIPLYNPMHWISLFGLLSYINKPFKVTCLVLKKIKK